MRERTMLVLAALLCFAAAIVLAPSGARSQAAPAPQASLAVPPPVLETPVAAVTPDGDAFAPRAPLDDDRPAPRAAVVPPLPPLPPPSARTLPHAPHLRLSAIALGARPTAIVEVDGIARSVTVGDALGGTRVAAIASDALVLADGRRVLLGAP